MSCSWAFCFRGEDPLHPIWGHAWGPTPDLDNQSRASGHLLSVAVTGGNFRDFEGTVVAAEGGRVTAELDIFGKRTRVELSPSDISPAGADDA